MRRDADALKIALLSASYAPEPTGIGPYSAELAQGLASRGHAVRVVAAFPFYPAWRPDVPRGTLLYRTERRPGVEVTRCRVYVPRRPHPMRRIVHELSWIASAAGVVPRLARWADVWIVVSPPFGSAVLGAFLARVLRARVHLHVQDVVPDVSIETGQLAAGLVVRFAKWLAGMTYRSFRSVSVLSESMATRVRLHTRRETGREVIAPNWVRQGPTNGAPLPKSLAGRRYALYAGSFGRKQDLAMLTEAARLLSAQEGPAIAVMGDGPGRETVEAASDRVVWLGLVDDGTYRSVLEHALAGIVALAPGVGDSVVPSKMASYLGAGRPVVVAADADSEAARIVGRAKCGFRIPPGRADLLARSLCLLAQDSRAREGFGAAGLAYANAQWDKETIIGRLEAALLALNGKRNTSRV